MFKTLLQIIGGLEYKDSYHNGGEWLNAVFLTNPDTRGVTGFVHAEDHYWDSNIKDFTGNGKAFKSISLGKIFLDTIMQLQFLLLSM